MPACAAVICLAACGSGPGYLPHTQAADDAVYCPENMVLACDSSSRIASAPRVCQCQPARQVLNTTIDH